MKKDKKYVITASLVTLGIFILAMVQNVIRYGHHDTYNPWRSLVYLIVSLLLFIPVLLFGLRCAKYLILTYPRYYWLLSLLLALAFVAAYFLLSSVIIHLLGFYDHFFSEIYARQYFGRESLFHLLLLIGTSLYVYITYRSQGQKTISGTKGRKSVTISTALIRWIEADDHYLKIHTVDSPLIKRSTLEKMAQHLKPDFIRIHRKYLVNKHEIVGTEKKQRDEFVILRTGERLKVGRSYMPLQW